MLLRRITIENFRGITKLAFELDRTTVLVGENNSGKTTVLEAINLCLARQQNRRVPPFEEYDYHLSGSASDPRTAPPISIQLDFEEEKADEWPDAVVQALDKALQVMASGLQCVRLRVSGSYDATLKEFVYSWDFLDLAGKALPRNPRLLGELQHLCPVFYLRAVRDAAQQFQGKAQFWPHFTRNLQLDDAKREELEQQIEEINQSVLDAHKPFDEIKSRIAKAAALVPLGQTDNVAIEALPARVFDMLSRTQVKMAATTGARLPVGQHGAGTQSLAVLFLFEAFLNAKLAEAFTAESEPILALEEPEAHLHPSAVRALWGTLDGLKGQKVLATHSGDLLSVVPLPCIRRLARKGGVVQAFRVNPGTLSKDDERKIGYHIRAKRGALFFARCWLLVEGESEYWFLPEAAHLTGKDFESNGVACLEFSQCGLEPFAKLANELGIEWHVLVDGDAEGAKYEKTATGLIGAALKEDRITRLTKDFEHTLWDHGYDHVYESSVGRPQQRAMIKSAEGDPDYPREVIKAALSGVGKPALSVAVVEAMSSPGSPGVPPEIAVVINKVHELVRR